MQEELRAIQILVKKYWEEHTFSVENIIMVDFCKNVAEYDQKSNDTRNTEKRDSVGLQYSVPDDIQQWLIVW